MLQGFELLAVNGVFLVLGLLQPEVVFQTAADGVIEGKLQDVASRGVGGDAAVEGIVRRGWIGALGASRKGTCKSQDDERQSRAMRKLVLATHCHHFLR